MLIKRLFLRTWGCIGSGQERQSADGRNLCGELSLAQVGDSPTFYRCIYYIDGVRLANGTGRQDRVHAILKNGAWLEVEKGGSLFRMVRMTACFLNTWDREGLTRLRSLLSTPAFDPYFGHLSINNLINYYCIVKYFY